LNNFTGVNLGVVQFTQDLIRLSFREIMNYLLLTARATKRHHDTYPKRALLPEIIG
jgi:hypothetical protein